MRSRTRAVLRISGLQQANVNKPWNGFGENPLSWTTTYENTRFGVAGALVPGGFVVSNSGTVSAIASYRSGLKASNADFANRVPLVDAPATAWWVESRRIQLSRCAMALRRHWTGAGRIRLLGFKAPFT